VLITPVIVMAAGQLAGGLAWLTISGEDAADLVATAPLSASHVTRAKIEVVLIAIGVTFAPLILALVFASPLQAVVTAPRWAAAVSATPSSSGFACSPPQPVSPPPNLVAASNLRGSLLLDRMAATAALALAIRSPPSSAA